MITTMIEGLEGESYLSGFGSLAATTRQTLRWDLRPMGYLRE